MNWFYVGMNFDVPHSLTLVITSIVIEKNSCLETDGYISTGTNTKIAMDTTCKYFHSINSNSDLETIIVYCTAI